MTTDERWLTAARCEDFDHGPVLCEATRERAIKYGHEQWGDRFWIERGVLRDGHYEPVGAPEYIVRDGKRQR